MSDWPAGVKLKPIQTWPGALTEKRRAAPFSAGLSQTLGTLTRELQHLGATDTIMQIAATPEDFRIDGRLRARATVAHPGIILTMDTKVGPLSYPCDTFLTWQTNLRAVALALEALRKVDRYGVTKRGEQYRGFAALEAPRAMPSGFQSAADAEEFLRDWCGSDWDGRTLRAVIREAKRTTHPDMSGDAATFDRVMQAERFLRDTGAI